MKNIGIAVAIAGALSAAVVGAAAPAVASTSNATSQNTIDVNGTHRDSGFSLNGKPVLYIDMMR